MTDLVDAHLLRLMRAGSTHLFDLVVEVYRPLVHALLFRRSGELEAPERLVREALRGIYGRLFASSSGEGLVGAVHQVMAAIEPDATADGAAGVAEGVTAGVAAGDRAGAAEHSASGVGKLRAQRVLIAAACALEPRLRPLFVLRFLYRVPYGECARLLVVAPSEVATALADLHLRFDVLLAEDAGGATSGTGMAEAAGGGATVAAPCADALRRLGAFVDGELDADAGRALAEHLGGCLACTGRERRVRAGAAHIERSVARYRLAGEHGLALEQAPQSAPRGRVVAPAARRRLDPLSSLAIGVGCGISLMFLLESLLPALLSPAPAAASPLLDPVRWMAAILLLVVTAWLSAIQRRIPWSSGGPATLAPGLRLALRGSFLVLQTTGPILALGWLAAKALPIVLRGWNLDLWTFLWLPAAGLLLAGSAIGGWHKR